MKSYLFKSSILLFFLLINKVTLACVTCNKKIQEAIFDSTFYPNLLAMLSPFIVLGILVALLSALATKRHKTRLAANSNYKALSIVPLTAAASVLGIGLGGFIDGIALHQILQWHEMLSNKIPPTDFVNKSVNMFWDGIFHAFTLIVTFIGVVLIWKQLWKRDNNRSGYLLSGGLLLGWAAFNIIEGIADHHILKLHNVREVTDNVAFWNYGFLGFSVVLLILGYLLIGKAPAEKGEEMLVK